MFCTSISYLPGWHHCPNPNSNARFWRKRIKELSENRTQARDFLDARLSTTPLRRHSCRNGGKLLHLKRVKYPELVFAKIKNKKLEKVLSWWRHHCDVTAIFQKMTSFLRSLQRRSKFFTQVCFLIQNEKCLSQVNYLTKTSYDII